MSNYILIHVITLYTVLTYIWKKDYDYTVPTYHYELIMDKIIMHWISKKKKYISRLKVNPSKLYWLKVERTTGAFT